MKSFNNNKLSSFPVSHELLRIVRVLGEYRGKEALYQNQAPQILSTLQQGAVIQSTESSNRIEGVTVSDTKRLRELVEKRIEPKNRSEQEIAGYRDALNTIHVSYAHIPITPNIVTQLHRDLFAFTNEPGGRWKSSDNTISETTADGTKKVRFQPVPAWQTADAIEQLHQQFGETKIEPLLAIPAYILDFLCIHPFRDGNGRMARLLSLLLLYKAGYTVGRYISLERIVEDTKESYYDALHASSQGWHDGKHDLNPWIEYFLGVMLTRAYKEFENSVGLVETAKGAKAAMIVAALERMPVRFSIADVAAACPTVGIDHIRRTLRAEKVAGRLNTEGKGPKAMWVKVAGVEG